jgi:uncharacterized protein (DUF2236 family)
MRANGDAGFFGPESASWLVHREVTVLFGGARALLMQAAHPLVVAGARQTGFYERNPWRRLQRTLMLTYAITFGTKREARAAAGRINDVHERVHGMDEITGLPYDALNPELLLWVHACLVDSALLFERLTVGQLDADGRQRFHDEQMLAAEMVRVPREMVPGTVEDLSQYIDDVAASGILRATDGSRAVADLFRHPPREAEWRPVLRGVSRWAFGSLPPEIRDLYGVRWNGVKETALRASLAALRTARPAIPRKFRFIAPYQEWLVRRDGRPAPAVAADVRRSMGIHLAGGEGEGPA